MNMLPPVPVVNTEPTKAGQSNRTADQIPKNTPKAGRTFADVLDSVSTAKNDGRQVKHDVASKARQAAKSNRVDHSDPADKHDSKQKVSDKDAGTVAERVQPADKTSETKPISTTDGTDITDTATATVESTVAAAQLALAVDASELPVAPAIPAPPVSGLVTDAPLTPTPMPTPGQMPELTLAPTPTPTPTPGQMPELTLAPTLLPVTPASPVSPAAASAITPITTTPIAAAPSVPVAEVVPLLEVDAVVDPTAPLVTDAADFTIDDPSLPKVTVGDQRLSTQAPTTPVLVDDAVLAPVLDPTAILDTLQDSVAKLPLGASVSGAAEASKILDPSITVMGDATAKSALDLMASTQRTAEVQNTANVKAAVTPQPLEPFKQVANIVAPLRQMADGDYTMSLKLHPAHLGSVEVAVTLNSGQISMQLNSENAASRQLLRDSMNELRAALESSGLSAGSLDVGSGDPRQQGSDNRSSGANQVVREWSGMDENDLFARLSTSVPSQDGNEGGPLDVRV